MLDADLVTSFFAISINLRGVDILIEILAYIVRSNDRSC